MTFGILCNIHPTLQLSVTNDRENGLKLQIHHSVLQFCDSLNLQTETLETQSLTWTQLGNTLDTSTHNRIDNIELVTDAPGSLVVAWQGDWQENGKIYAKRWLEDEKRWKALAVVTPSSGGDFSLSASQHKLGVAFAKTSSSNNQLKSFINVKREKGQGWETLGSTFRNDVGSTFSLAMNNQANPFIRRYQK